jgi:PST family polysaccharide transporter
MVPPASPEAPPAEAPVAEAQAAGDPPASNLAHQTVRAATWTIASGMGTRLLGVVGLTRFVLPYDYGQAAAAGILGSTANQFSQLNLGTYILANPKAGRDVMFHATALHLGLGFLAYAVIMIIGPFFGPMLDAPELGKYLPGMVLALAIDRVTYMPERVLVRTMRFGAMSVARSVGDVAYTAASIGTAVFLGWTGMAIVAGNLARAAVRLVVTWFYVDWRDWLEGCRLRWQTLREMITFGLPITIGSLAGFGMRRWDNLVVSRFFGPAVMAEYSLAYNLADIPAVQVGEEIADVLQAAFARVPGDDGKRALLRSVGLLALIMTPMAIGLGCVGPTLTAAFIKDTWSGVGPMLTALAVISFTRPISGTVGGYLEIRGRQKLVGAIDVFTLLLLLAALWTLGRLGPLWSCAAVGLAFFLRMLIWGWALKVSEQIKLRTFLAPLVPAVLASLPLVAAAVGTQRLMAAILPGYLLLSLVAQIIAGVAGYLVGALLFARGQSRELISLVRQGLSRRRAKAAAG